MKTIDAIDVLVNKIINDEKAPNYKGWIVSDENTGNEYVITVQLKDGETPSQQLATAKAEVAEYRRFMKDLLDNHELGDKLDFEMADLLAKHKGE